jgi:hypothetical protein
MRQGQQRGRANINTITNIITTKTPGHEDKRPIFIFFCVTILCLQSLYRRYSLKITTGGKNKDGRTRIKPEKDRA